jgi:recombination protein RecA
MKENKIEKGFQLKSKFASLSKKDKILADIMYDYDAEKTYLSTNVISLNLLFSGKIRGGITKGKISTIAADSSWGKSIIGLHVLKAAQKAKMACVVIDAEHAFNIQLASDLGIDMSIVDLYQTASIPKIKAIYAKINDSLKTKEERQNTFFLLDSWGPLVSDYTLAKATEGSGTQDMGQLPRLKNELCNLINEYGNTNFIVNQVMENPGQMMGEKFSVPGGKRLFFLSDAIVLCSSAAKDKNKDGSIRGKIITAGCKKGRSAKEMTKTKYRIMHNGGIDPFYGLLQDAMDAGVVIKPKNGVYTRPDYDKDGRTWKEEELYTAYFWIPLYNDETFNHFCEAKYSFEEARTMITSEIDVLSDMDALLNDPNFMDKIKEQDQEIANRNKPITYGEEGTETENDAFVDMSKLNTDESTSA